MKRGIFLVFLFICHSGLGQQPFFQSFEVDSAAVPRGGITYLNTFLQANLRKPILAEAQGVGGRVIVTAVVEPNGRVTEARLIKSLRPDCDREALRVFQLFNAWKPAQKAGKVVRQLVTIPILFAANTPYTFANGTRLNYFGDDMKSVLAGSDLARYKQEIPIDTSTDLPNGDLITFQREGTQWKEISRLPLTRKPESRRRLSGLSTYLLGHMGPDGQWQGTLFTVSETGTILRRVFYEDGRTTGTEFAYYADGMLAERRETVEKQYAITNWYANGQIRQVWLADKNLPPSISNPDKITAYWDSTGRQSVKEGTGYASYTETMRSLSDTARTTQNTEQGAFENGVKQGIWTGRYADGSYVYEERYEQGICKGGKACEAGRDTVRYPIQNQNPAYKGGMSALGEFLNRNLHYPERAVKAGVAGKVFVSFVINTDGSVQDVTVFKGIGFGCDEEAKRVVSRMQGNWTPGIQRGKRVRVKFNLPINFSFR